MIWAVRHAPVQASGVCYGQSEVPPELSSEEAAEAGDLVVATIPLKNYAQLPASALAGKTVIDTMNYYPDRDHCEN